MNNGISVDQMFPSVGGGSGVGVLGVLLSPFPAGETGVVVFGPRHEDKKYNKNVKGIRRRFQVMFSHSDKLTN